MSQVEVTITITDFQSIEKVTLTIDGFTALVGRSNIGKSAVIRAIRCALTNSLGTSFVRHGENCARLLRGGKSCKCYASVHIKTENFDLLWEKGDSVNRYSFNGSVYDKPGQGVPEFLTGFSPVKVGDSSRILQVVDQFYPIFLLDQSGPAIAEAISDVARLDRINRATKLVEHDRKEAVSTKKVKERDAAELKLRLESYSDLPKLSLQVDQVENHLESLDALDARFTQVSSFLDTFSRVDNKVQGLDQVLSLPTSDLSPLSNAQVRFIQVSSFLDIFSRVNNRVQGLDRVLSLPTSDLSPLLDAQIKVKTLTDFENKLAFRNCTFSVLVGVVKRLSKTPEVSPLQELQEAIQQFNSWISRGLLFKEKFTSLEKTSRIEPSSIEPLLQSHSKVKNLNNLSVRQESLGGIILGLTTQFETISKELLAIEVEAKKLGICPTCTQPLLVEHVHA